MKEEATMSLDKHVIPSNKIIISLNKEFKSERQKERNHLTFFYIPNQAREKYRLDYNNGYFTNNKQILDGKYMYVRLLNGIIYIASDDKENDLYVGHHSYLSNGKKVTSAGYFIFKNGRMKLVSNESGHYIPSNDKMKSDIEFYFEIAKNEKLVYEDHSKFPKEKQKYLYYVKDIIDKGFDLVKPYGITSGKSFFGAKLRNNDQSIILNDSASKNHGGYEDYYFTPNSPLNDQKSSIKCAVQ